MLGINTAAGKAGVAAGDVLVEVEGQLVTMMTHPQVPPCPSYPQVCGLIRGVRGATLRLRVERGDHIVPNMQVRGARCGVVSFLLSVKRRRIVFPLVNWRSIKLLDSCQHQTRNPTVIPLLWQQTFYKSEQ